MDCGVVVSLESWGSVPLSLLMLVREVGVLPGVQVGGVGGGVGEVMEELLVGLVAHHSMELGGGVGLGFPVYGGGRVGDGGGVVDGVPHFSVVANMFVVHCGGCPLDV